jgi:transketolase
MRNSFAKSITDLSKKNKKIVLLAGDIGNKLFDNFKKIDKNRFFNCGVAEANMTGVAAGLAIQGFRPITYTITPFNTLRCLEQIKIDICYPKLPVIIVGTGAGLSYSALGATHHSLDDIAIMRALPNMNVVCPSDPIEVAHAIEHALKIKGPTYIRIGKKGEPIINKKNIKFRIGKINKITSGKDISILSVGNIMKVSMECQKILSENNISTELVSLHTIKPLDKNYLKKVFKKKLVVCIEEHSIIGGAGSAILEFCNLNSIDTSKLMIFSAPDKFLSKTGSQEQTRKKIGLNSQNIVKKIKKKIKKFNGNKNWNRF